MHKYGIVKCLVKIKYRFEYLISFNALSTAFSLSPATIATGSPTLLTLLSSISLSYGDGSGKVWPAMLKRLSGTSFHV